MGPMKSFKQGSRVIILNKIFRCFCQGDSCLWFLTQWLDRKYFLGWTHRIKSTQASRKLKSVTMDNIPASPQPFLSGATPAAGTLLLAGVWGAAAGCLKGPADARKPGGSLSLLLSKAKFAHCDWKCYRQKVRGVLICPSGHTLLLHWYFS